MIGHLRRAVAQRRPAVLAIVALVAASLVVIAPEAGPKGSPAPAQAAEAPGPTRVMIEGDSITQGFSGDITWRYWIAREFRRQRIPVDFVGPHPGTSQGPVDPFGGRYKRPFDGDHSARVHSTLWGHEHLGTLEERMHTYDPDVILLLVGYNDLALGTRPKKVLRGLRKYVATVHGISPETKIVIGTIMPSVDRKHKPRPVPRRLVNVGINRIVAADERISLARTAWRWRPRRWTIDGLHPSPTGETVIAQRFGAGLKAAGVFHRRPHLIRRVRWNPSIVMRRRGLPRRFVVRWPGQKREWSVTRFRVAYAKVGTRGWFFRGTRDERIVIRRLQPGIYRMRTIPFRKQLRGVPTPIVRVWVRPRPRR